MNQQQHKGILVLGMHRSGTSAVTGMLAMAGGVPPNDVMPPTEDNPRGYWESSRIVQFNNALLVKAGTRWNVADPIDGSWFEAADRDEDVVQAARLIDTEFPANGPLLLKDPRICRLLPVWMRAFELRGIESHAVLVTRSPLDVASSLRRRADNTKFRPASIVSVLSSLLLWLRYNLDAEFHSRNIPRTILEYETVLGNCCTLLLPLLSLGILPGSSSLKFNEIQAFLDPSLNREGEANDKLCSTYKFPGSGAAHSVRTAIHHGDYLVLDRFRSLLTSLSDPLKAGRGERDVESVLLKLDGLHS